nr:hypothetical protein [Mycobacterium eburneum]
MWKRLAALVAAPGRARMRLWNPDTGKFDDTARRSDVLPARPAAVYMYTRRRTRVLCLDFDAKHHGAAAAAADLARAAAWFRECGGVVVTDRSTSGGRHLLCPLAIGTTASIDELVPLVRLLAARLSTLDITPNTGADKGCITPPGSPCREGGYRELDGPLQDAVQAFTTRSSPDLLPRLSVLLGALRPSPQQRATDPAHPVAAGDGAGIVGYGDDQRLAPDFVREDPMPADVAAYAEKGIRNPQRDTWQSHHEPRMSVITHAVWRGHTHASIRDLIAPGGPWHDGLGRAYQRYHTRADDALGRDITKALNWLSTNLPKSHPPRHKTQNSPGGQQQGRGPCGPRSLREWLANAMRWADHEYAGKRVRWTVHAVLQALAYHAVTSGEQRSGVWLTGVGGRSLSLATGLLSPDTVWRVLADLRERPGSPIVLARHHVGLDADTYALTRQNIVTNDPAHAQRIRIEPVHPAWFILGHHLRRVHELITDHGLTRKADIYTAAGIPRSTGDTAIADLQTAGLVTTTGRGTVAPGPTTLDDIAAAHHLAEISHERAELYRTERTQWRDRLNHQTHQPHPTEDPETIEQPYPVTAGHNDHDDHDAWLESVMATGPPPMDDIALEREIIDMTTELLGARIISPVPGAVTAT